MKNNNGENLYTMNSGKSSLVSMSSRSRNHNSSVVVKMPSRDQHAKVVDFPATDVELGSHVASRLQSGLGTLSLGVRMTLVALFALLGWPRPTRDNDPGPSAARPCRWERTTLISHAHLISTGGKAAAGERKAYARAA